jgi:hypothetical protein
MKGLSTVITLGILWTAQPSFANVAVVAGDCSGSLFKMPGMHDSDKALVLTAGHCVGVGSLDGRYPADGEVFLNHPASDGVIVRTAKNEQGERLGYRRILFVSMTGTDLAVIELDASVRQLVERGYTVYSLAPEIPKPGLTLEFDSYNRDVHSICEVDGIVPVVKEGPWRWEHSVRLKAGPACQYQPGQSGTAGIDTRSKLIYAIAQTGYQGGPPCSLNNPCEVHPGTGAITTAQIDQGYAIPTAALLGCYDQARREFDFDQGTCTLRGKTRR